MVAKGARRTHRSMWVPRAEERDDHPVVIDIGHVVHLRSVRPRVANEHIDLVKLTTTPSDLKPHGDDVEIQERWAPTEGCKACESAHANTHTHTS